MKRVTIVFVYTVYSDNPTSPCTNITAVRLLFLFLFLLQLFAYKFSELRFCSHDERHRRCALWRSIFYVIFVSIFSIGLSAV